MSATYPCQRPALDDDAHASLEDSLHRHLLQCRGTLGRWFGAAQWAERVHGWFVPRLVTTVALAAAVLAIGLSWL